MSYFTHLDDDNLFIIGYNGDSPAREIKINCVFSEHINHIEIRNIKSILIFTAKLPTNLKKISIEECNLYSFETELPSSLETLMITNCKLRNFNLKLPSSLIELILDGSNIKSIDTELPSNLEILSIEECNFRKFKIKLPSSLKELNIFETKIKKLKLSHSPGNLIYNINILKNGKTCDKDNFYMYYDSPPRH